jgi:peptide chain release factor subunit 1
VAAVETLLVQDGTVVPGVFCAHGHWLALEGATCPVCGRSTLQTPDVVDHLIETVIDESGSIRHVHADSELRDQLVGAYLRFPLPPLPDGLPR